MHHECPAKYFALFLQKRSKAGRFGGARLPLDDGSLPGETE